MSDFRPFRLGAALIAVTALLAAKTAPAGPGPAGCDVDSPHATSFIATANATFPHLDSLRAARLGWHAAPKSVALVKEAKKCDAIMAAHNKFVDGKQAYHVSNAAIVQAGNSYLVDVPPGNGVAQHMIFVYDSTLKFTAIY
jgi:hypothetical protein